MNLDPKCASTREAEEREAIARCGNVRCPNCGHRRVAALGLTTCDAIPNEAELLPASFAKTRMAQRIAAFLKFGQGRGGRCVAVFVCLWCKWPAALRIDSEASTIEFVRFDDPRAFRNWVRSL